MYDSRCIRYQATTICDYPVNAFQQVDRVWLKNIRLVTQPGSLVAAMNQTLCAFFAGNYQKIKTHCQESDISIARNCLTDCPPACQLGYKPLKAA